ncbi:MAG TPA: hypothetical protein VMD97_10165 [Candidatus Aquilonibacter sp.]|nr:hypothetical protein [Candidatus Aquilonibacter sp.]
MRIAIRFLFPWTTAYQRLELEKRWWHRLAVVLFFVVLIPPFVFSWVTGNEANAPTDTVEQAINYWAILPPPPNATARGMMFDSAPVTGDTTVSGADDSSGGWEPVPTPTPNPQSTRAGDPIPAGATIGAPQGANVQTLPPGYTVDETPTSGGEEFFDEGAAELSAPPALSPSDRGKVVMLLASVPLVPGHQVRSQDQRKTIEMPNGKTATFSGNTSDEAIKAEWKHQLHLAFAKAALIGFGIAVLVTVALSYLLQAAYRVLLYVIYGTKASVSPDNPLST